MVVDKQEKESSKGVKTDESPKQTSPSPRPNIEIEQSKNNKNEASKQKTTKNKEIDRSSDRSQRSSR